MTVGTTVRCSGPSGSWRAASAWAAPARASSALIPRCGAEPECAERPVAFTITVPAALRLTITCSSPSLARWPPSKQRQASKPSKRSTCWNGPTRHSSSHTSSSAASAKSARRSTSARSAPRARTSPPFMSTVPEPTSRSSSRRSGRWSACAITVSRWPRSRIRLAPVPGRRTSRSRAWSAEEHGTRSTSASSGASAAATAAASSAPWTSPLGEETATSASSSRGARAAMAPACFSIQSFTCGVSYRPWRRAPASTIATTSSGSSVQRMRSMSSGATNPSPTSRSRIQPNSPSQ